MLLDPLSFLLLGKGERPLRLLDDLVEVYAELLERLTAAGVPEVQLDEPVLAADRIPEDLAALRRVYERLGSLPSHPRLLVVTSFGEIGDAPPILAATRVESIGPDLVAGPGNLRTLAARAATACRVTGPPMEGKHEKDHRVSGLLLRERAEGTHPRP